MDSEVSNLISRVTLCIRDKFNRAVLMILEHGHSPLQGTEERFVFQLICIWAYFFGGGRLK